MFWPQSLFEWVAVFAIIFFLIQAFRMLKKDHEEDDVFEPIKHVGRRMGEETFKSEERFQTVLRYFVQGNNKKRYDKISK